MKFLDEYRDADLTRKLLADIQKTVTRPWTLMEVCGGQTHSIIKSGLDRMLPAEINLIHGPGCPVCVPPLELVDKAIALASRPEVVFTSYGDMLRVPGSRGDLFSVKAAGAISASSTPRLTPCKLPGIIPKKRSCSLPLASRPPPRPTPWRSSRPGRRV